MKKVILFASICFITIFTNCTLHAQWFQQVSNVYHVLNSVHCSNDTVCYTVGDYGERLNTHNGGNTWNNVKWFGDNDLSSVYVFNYSLAFAAGMFAIVEFVDSGYTQGWGGAACLKFGRGIYCVNDTTGYAVGDSGVIARCDTLYSMYSAVDYWYCLNSNTNNNLYSVHFPSRNVGYIVGDSGTIIKTVDGGINWMHKNSGVTTNLRSVHFINNSVGFAVGNNGLILKTQDGGDSWIAIQSNVPNNLNSVCFPSDSIGYIAADGGLILKTNDSGNTWITQITGVPYNLKSVYFTNNDIGYAVGANGTILKTIYGGTVGIADSKTGNEMTVLAYPNPTIDYITLEKSNSIAQSYVVIIKNIQGQELQREKINFSNSYKINVSDLNNGVYFLTLQNDKESYTRKIVIQK